MRRILRTLALLALPFCFGTALAQAPQWMHAAAGSAVPPQDDRTEAVLLYSERNVSVVSSERVKTQVRMAYRILKPGGRDYGTVVVPFNFTEKVTNLHAWSIPAQGKDYEVKEKEAVEVGVPKIEGSELVSDVRAKVLRIPAPDPGNVVGFEYEIEERPMLLQDTWQFQQEVPVLEARYSLQIPAGWEYKPVWLNASEVQATQSDNKLLWVVRDQKPIRAEEDMPPRNGVAGHLVLSFLAPGGNATSGGTATWQQLGTWYLNLTKDRTESSPEIAQKVTALATGSALEKMKAIASFAQHDIRYVAIELGIGGWQPHPAKDIFTNRYGDCKDKATLMQSMLRGIGIDSYYVIINTVRGSVGPNTPPNPFGFNHAILAIKLPPELSNQKFAAALQHPKLGTTLFFDPTDELTPFGEISGSLQANYALLVTPEGGELVQLPQQPAAMNGIKRTAKFSLTPTGALTGHVDEVRRGDQAWMQRWAQRNAKTDQERVKPIESLLAGSLSNFRITQANVINLSQMDQPFGFKYDFAAERYAKNAGGLLLVRPRVLGVKTRGILETDKPRQYPIEFDSPELDEDVFEIELPIGYEIDELPPPVDVEYSFARYHSKTEAKGNSIVYTRTLEIKELSVPVSKAEELKKFYRIIAGDERNTAVIKPK